MKREKYFEKCGKRHKKNVEERERMKNDPQVMKNVIKRQATTARRNLKSEVKKTDREVYEQNKCSYCG